MAKNPIPDDCTSMLCDDLGGEYCQECSHAIFRGRSKVDGVMYRWEYQPYYGLEFYKKNGDPVVVCPGMKNPVWDRYSKWRKRRGLR